MVQKCVLCSIMFFYTEHLIGLKYLNYEDKYFLQHYSLFSVSTAALRAGPLQFGAELPVRLVGKKSSQGIGLAVTPQDGSILFSPVSETAIAQWNPKTNEQKFVLFLLYYQPNSKNIDLKFVIFLILLAFFHMIKINYNLLPI